jgi:hypothetical protein
MEPRTRAGRITSSRVLAVPEPVQLVIVESKGDPTVSASATAACLTNKESYDAAAMLKPIIVRLENIPATPQNRKQIEDRIRDLNRILEESGTPFRLRLL